MTFKAKELWADKTSGWSLESIEKLVRSSFKQGVYEYSDWIVKFADGSEKPFARYVFNYWEQTNPFELPAGLYETPQ